MHVVGFILLIKPVN